MKIADESCLAHRVTIIMLIGEESIARKSGQDGLVSCQPLSTFWEITPASFGDRGMCHLRREGQAWNHPIRVAGKGMENFDGL